MAQILRYIARTWPHGVGCLWLERADKPGSADPEGGTILGLSNQANFNKLDVEQHYETRALTQRGLGGITAYGKNLVRSSAELLQRAYGKECLSFLTLTLPGSAEVTCEIAAGWSKLVNHFLTVLRRDLSSAGLPDYVVGVTEVQEERFLREGGMPLHLHLIFVGRKSARSRWSLSADRMRDVWKNCVTAIDGGLSSYSFRASVDMQPVRKDAGAYLGKYMSKGVGCIEQIRQINPALLEFLPRSWYFCTRAMRDAALAHVAYGPDHGAVIKGMIDAGNSELLFRWVHTVPIVSPEGHIIGDCVIYHLRSPGLELLGLHGVTPGYFAYP